MKHIVTADAYHQGDVKPLEVLEEYARRLHQDVTDLWRRASVRERACPACQSREKQRAFDQFQQTYYACGACQTLYVASSPDDQDIARYYRQSPSRLFWREKVSKATEHNRRLKIIQPRIQWILESTQEYLPGARHWVDVNTAQDGYVQAISSVSLFSEKSLLNPFVKIEQKDIKVMRHEAWGEILENQVDVMSLFEVADHTADVQALLAHVTRSLRAGGLCFLTAILSTGFDIQTLWARAENIYPPDRLNLFSVRGLRELFKQHHLECLEFSTPGVLDVEIVAKAVERNPDIEVPRFVQTLLSQGQETRRDFQDFLQANLLSSYGRILLRKAAS